MVVVVLMAEILRENQLRLVVYPIYDGFHRSQVVSRISEPSTVGLGHGAKIGYFSLRKKIKSCRHCRSTVNLETCLMFTLEKMDGKTTRRLMLMSKHRHQRVGDSKA